ncbi:MAG: hypothetical protein EXS31_02570 [Pedosphaera sp.]|nr:hypothetical protein [Pedosphaera sp.]
MAWPESVRKVTLRLGVSVVPWRTVAWMDRITQSTTSTRHAGDPNWTVNFHLADEKGGQAQVTVVRGYDDRNWLSRVIAMDIRGREHTDLGGTGTSADTMQAWTYTFPLPLADVKEFRAQIRPMHWVEFRDVMLHPLNGAQSQPGGYPSHPSTSGSTLSFGSVQERTLTK